MPAPRLTYEEKLSVRCPTCHARARKPCRFTRDFPNGIKKGDPMGEEIHAMRIDAAGHARARKAHD